ALPILSAAERRQLLEGWNATEAEYPSERCVHALFEAPAERTPEATAVVYEERSLSYGALNVRANRLAHHLRSLGVGPDVPVAICVERSLEMVVGLLAVLKAGGAYVPLDPAYPAARLGFMLEDAAPAVVLTHGAARDALAAAMAGLPGSPALIDLDEAGLWAAQPDANPDPAAVGLTSAHLAYVIYTSGSTGTPKGVMVEHRNVANYLSWAQAAYRLDEGCGAPVNTSLAFDATVTSLWAPLISGGALTLLAEGELAALSDVLA